MGYLDSPCAATQSHLQGVVAHHPQGGKLRRGTEGAIAAGGEQQIGFDHIPALETHVLTCFGQGPQLAAALE
ncbi:hypothetical protein D3C73_1493830 [compost metagenome]